MMKSLSGVFGKALEPLRASESFGEAISRGAHCRLPRGMLCRARPKERFMLSDGLRGKVRSAQSGGPLTRPLDRLSLRILKLCKTFFNIFKYF